VLGTRKTVAAFFGRLLSMFRSDPTRHFPIPQFFVIKLDREHVSGRKGLL